MELQLASQAPLIQLCIDYFVTRPNLAPGTRAWRADEIIDGALPTSLDGVSVLVNGKPTAVSYISPSQINVQAPDDTTRGNVTVTVLTPKGSARASSTLSDYSPAFFVYDAGGLSHVVAQHADYSLVGPQGVFPNVTPARPGEVVILYGTGFGPTDPPIPAGRLVTTPAPLVDVSRLKVRIASVPVEVLYAGLIMAGLWQMNVKIPESAPDGDAMLEAEIGDVRSSLVRIAVKAAPSPLALSVSP